MAITDVARLAMMGLPKYIRQEIGPLERKTYLYGEMKSRGKITMNNGGEVWEWRPRKRFRPVLIEIQINVPDDCNILLGSPLRIHLERIHAHIDVGAANIFEPEPCLETRSSQLLCRRNPLNEPIAIFDYHGQPVFRTEVIANVIP